VDALVYLLIWLGKAAIKAYRRRQARAAGLPVPDDDEGHPAQVPGPATAPAEVDALAREASGLDASARALADRARAFAATPGRDDAERALRAVARDHLAGAAEGVVDRARLVSDRPRELGRLARGLGFHSRTLTALERLDGQRADVARRGLLRDVEAVAMAFYRPLLDSQARRGFPLYTRQTVAVLGESPGLLSGLLAGTAVAPIEASVRTQVDALAWPLVAREVGRDILLSTDGMLEQVRAAAGYPAPRPPPAPGYLTEDDVIGALGSWQTELCADAVATLLLGPAYLAALTGLLKSPDQPYRIRLVELREDGAPTPTPPADLRVACAAQVLDRVGYLADAERITGQWREQHPLDLEYFYPTGGGRYAAVPEDLYSQPVQDLAAVVCQHQLQALAGMQLMDVPGLHHSLGRQREVEQALDRLRAGGAPVQEDPRVIVAAAALLAHERPALRNQLVPTLRGAIVGGRDDPAVAVPVTPRGEREELFDPAVLRDALVLEDVFRRRTAAG